MSGSDKLALIGIVLGVAGVVFMFGGLIYLFVLTRERQP